ncbi:MAG: hypothetical protein KDD89_14585, partial [Anaerolineales bacterium]|nr:hypothetical protein [Anaerolineales bacterium]
SARWLAFVFLFVLGVLVGCQTSSDVPLPTAVPSLIPVTPSAMPPAVSAPTATASPPAPPTSTAVMQPATTGADYQDLALNPEQLYLHPVPVLYAGDKATIQIGAHVPSGVNMQDVVVQVLVDGSVVGQNRLNMRNFAGDTSAVFNWVWDTTTSDGSHELAIYIDPEDRIQIGDENLANNVLTQTITVLPANQRPVAERNWQWTTAETEYAYVHVVEGTAAHRDFNDLLQATDDAVAFAADKLQVKPERKLDVYFIDRVIGQGGYAGNSLVVSYPDRNYAGGGLWEVLVHEVVHVLDLQIAPRRMPFLAEGVAVWATGGHYKQENLHTRTAALQELGLFVPLTDLANDFYPLQHEIGYLQAAGLVSYLVEQYGWEATRNFYASVEPVDGQTNAEVLSTQLQNHFGLTSAQLEEQWRNFLRNQPYDPNAIPDLQTTVRYYDIMRRYQQAHDPTAYFMTAWLPSPLEMRQREITADLTRHPTDEIN